jgi:hypothetical protein
METSPVYFGYTSRLAQRDRLQCLSSTIYTKQNFWLNLLPWPQKWQSNIVTRIIFYCRILRFSQRCLICWDKTLCSPLNVSRRFGGVYYLYLQWRINRERYQRESRWQAFTLLSCSACSTLMMVAVCSTETSIDSQRTTRRYIPEDKTLQFLFVCKTSECPPPANQHCAIYVQWFAIKWEWTFFN